MRNIKKDSTNLRNKIDGDDRFFESHQIKSVRTLIGQKKTPIWAMSDKKIREILLGSFPRLATDKKQRKSAARWNQAITLVYRVGMPYNHAAAEMGIKVDTLRSLLRGIRRAGEGRRADTSETRKGSRGRPKTNKCHPS